MTKDIYDREFNILGYKTGGEITKIDSDLLIFKDDFSNVDFSIKNSEWSYNKNKLIKTTKNFFDEFLNLNDVKFVSNKTKRSIKLKSEFLGLKEDKINLKLQKDINIISPFELPIFTRDYSALEPFFYEDSVYLTGISLEEKKSKDILCAYVHELIHGQLYMKKGSVENYKNSEVLSIFFEFLSAYYLDKSRMLLDQMLKQRCDDTIRMINMLIVVMDNNKVKLACSTYIESSLIAMKLFDLYMNSNDLIKKEIMYDIQNIIDGNFTLEEILNKYDVIYESSKQENVFKKYIKQKKEF